MNLPNCIKPYNKSKNKNLKPFIPNVTYNTHNILQSSANCGQEEETYDSYYNLNQLLMFIENDFVAAGNEVFCPHTQLSERYLS